MFSIFGAESTGVGHGCREDASGEPEGNQKPAQPARPGPHRLQEAHGGHVRSRSAPAAELLCLDDGCCSVLALPFPWREASTQSLPCFALKWRMDGCQSSWWPCQKPVCPLCMVGLSWFLWGCKRAPKASFNLRTWLQKGFDSCCTSSLSLTSCPCAPSYMHKINWLGLCAFRFCLQS